MPRLPDASVLGARPTPQSGRGVTSVQDVSGRAVAELGEALGRMGEEIARKDDTQAIFEARRKLDDWERAALYDPENGVVAKRGADALDLPKRIPQDFDKFAGEVAGTLTSERQRQAFQELVANRRNQVAGFTVRHAAREKEVFETGQVNADLESSGQRAILLAANGDTGAAKAEIDLALTRQTAFLKQRGKSGEEIAAESRKYASKVHAGVLAAMVDKGNTEGASAYLEANRGAMNEADAIRAGGALREGQARQRAQAFGDEAMEAGWTLTQALDKARERFAGDDEVKAVAELKTRFAEREAAQAAAQKETSDAAWKLVVAGGGRKSIPVDVWNALPGREQGQILAYEEARAARARAEAERRDKPVETDMPTYMRLRKLATGNPEAFKGVDLERYQFAIGKTEMKELLTLQDKADKPEELAEVNTIDKQIADTVGKLKLGGKGNEQDRAKLSAAIRQAIDAEATARGKKKLTGPERQQIIDRFTMEVEVESFLWNKKKPAFKLEPDDEIVVPDADRQQITEALRAKGIAITEDAVLNLYKRARGIQ